MAQWVEQQPYDVPTLTFTFTASLGSRTQHMYQTEVEVFSDLCYYSLTTLLGTQTLGEEYCDIMQINSSTGTFPSLPVSALAQVYLTPHATIQTTMLLSPTLC